MNTEKNRVCPVGMAGSLDNRVRRWLQDPRKILRPYLKEGMTVLDLGCGPGFFTLEIARMVGRTGRVIAADFQEGMLAKLRAKIQGTELAERIVLHTCAQNTIGWRDQVDFVLAFYVVHEIPTQPELFKELASIVRPDGQVLLVEPPFHVSKSAFRESVRLAQQSGFKAEEGPNVFFGRTAILKGQSGV